jgi:hypothetical protein
MTVNVLEDEVDLINLGVPTEDPVYSYEI